MMISKLKKQQEQPQPNQIYTTVKKQPKNREYEQNVTPHQQIFKGKNQHQRHDRLSNKKYQVQRIYQDLMNKSQYSQAQKARLTIKYVEDQQKKRNKKILQKQHSIQKYAIRRAHKGQINMLRQTWKKVMHRQQTEQQQMLQKLAMLRNRDEQICKNRIIKRCQSAKPASKIAKIYELQQIERLLRKRGKTVELKSIREQKKKLIVQCKRQHEKSCQKIAEYEQKRMRQKQTKRYYSFMHRIQQKRNDNQRLYRRQEYRLKKKYQNIFKNLQHEQKLTYLQI